MPWFKVLVETNWCGASTEAVIEADDADDAVDKANEWANEAVGMFVSAEEIDPDSEEFSWYEEI